MRTIGIRHHLKLLVMLDQLIDQDFGVLVVHIIISRAVNEQQIPFKIGSMRYWRVS